MVFKQVFDILFQQPINHPIAGRLNYWCYSAKGLWLMLFIFLCWTKAPNTVLYQHVTVDSCTGMICFCSIRWINQHANFLIHHIELLNEAQNGVMNQQNLLIASIVGCVQYAFIMIGPMFVSIVISRILTFGESSKRLWLHNH